MESLKGTPEEILGSLQTGDILFFRSEKLAGRTLRVVIPGSVSFEHLGVVIRRTDAQAKEQGLAGLWLLEAVGGSCCQFDPLPMKVFLSHHDFAFHLAVRHLRGFRRDAEFETKALEFAKRAENVPYSAPGAMITAGVLAPSESPGEVRAGPRGPSEGYFCSSLVAHFLIELGVLQNTVDWSRCIPTDFLQGGGVGLLEKKLVAGSKRSKGMQGMRYSRMYLLKYPGSSIAKACDKTDFLSKAEAIRLYDDTDQGEWDQDWLRGLLGDHYRPDAGGRKDAVGVERISTQRALRLGVSYRQPQVGREGTCPVSPGEPLWTAGASGMASGTLSASRATQGSVGGASSMRVLRTYGTLSRCSPQSVAGSVRWCRAPTATSEPFPAAPVSPLAGPVLQESEPSSGKGAAGEQ